MKFEEYINKNKEDLDYQLDADKIWTKIEEKYTKISWYRNPKTYFILLLITGFSLVVFYNIKSPKSSYDEHNQNQIFALKSKFTSLSQDENMGNRLMAINISSEINSLDQEIINTLIDRMKNDESDNVKLAALRALEEHKGNEAVRIAMIEELSQPNTEYFKIKLMNILSDAKEKRILPYLDSIIDDGTNKKYILEEALNNKESFNEM